MTEEPSQSNVGFRVVIFPEVEGNFVEGMGPPQQEKASVLEFRHGNSPSFYPIKMPGLGKVGNAVMLDSTFSNTSAFQAWAQKVENGTVPLCRITVTFFGTNEPETFWNFEDAKPVEVSTPQPRPDGNSVTIEKIEIEFAAVRVSSQP